MAENVYTSGQYLEMNPSWHIEESPWKVQHILPMMRRHHLLPNTVCEVGCGFGEVLRLMQMRMSDACTFWGYDISPQAIENPQGQLRNSGWPKQIHECCYYHNANGYLKKDGTEA